MRSLFPVAGWVLAILLLLFAVERHMAVGRLQARVLRLERGADAMAAEGVSATAQRDNAAKTRVRLAKAQSEVARLEARLKEALSEADAFRVPAEEDVGVERRLVDTNAPQAEAAGAEPNVAEALLDAIAKDPAGEAAERFAQSSVQMHDGEFLQGLDLAPELVDEVRAAMLEVMRDMATNGVCAPGDFDSERLSEEEY